MSTSSTKFWAGLKKVGQTLVGPLLAVVVVVGAFILVSFGIKNLQIGGILGAVLGKKRPGTKAIDAANSVPKNRVDANGNLIPIGQADQQGMTQAAVVPIQSPGLFSDPSTVKFIPPGTAIPVEVQLPEGVKNSDVEHVVVIRPGEFVVTVDDMSRIKAKNLDDLLAKYGS